MRLNKKVAIVTGAARGIGLQIVRLFAEEGALIVMADIDEGALTCAAKKMSDEGYRVVPKICDVTKRDLCESVFRVAQEHFDGADILVNNAGLTRDAMIHKMTDAEWDTVMNIHAKGCFNMCRAAAPYMRKENHGGAIVNVSSVSAELGTPGQTNYAAAKAAIVGITRSLANEWARFFVRCNAVSFGFVDTRLTRPKEEGEIVDGKPIGIPQAIREKSIARIPLGFAASTLDAAYPVLFLASNEARYITGQVLSVNGGSHM